MTKNIEIQNKFKKLNEIEHVLKRPGRYLGTVNPTTIDTYIIENNSIVWKSCTYSPAFLKIFDEIISNSADFSKTAEGKHVTKIEVNINQLTGEISVFDDGGIPVIKHTEHNEYIPEMIFGSLRSGSNFDDAEDSITTGQNGEGATLTNIFSKKFIIETCDGKNYFSCTYKNNMSEKEDNIIKKSKKNHTKITYIPDYDKFGIQLDKDHYDILIRRVHEIAATNCHLQVYLNGQLIKYKSFNDFCKLFNEDNIYFGNDRFEICVFPSKNGFQHITFVNSTNVSQGGTHVDYIINQIISSIRDNICKKTKQDIKPNNIKNHFFLMMNCTINNPRYNSQTKEKLETQPKNFGCSYEIDPKTTNKILKSNIVSEIIAWAENKFNELELQEANKKDKELDRAAIRNITKYEGANSKDRSKCILFISEGDSAAKPLQSARNPNIHGVFPLRGKPLNVRGKKIKDLLANTELNELMQIIGLRFGTKPDINTLRYKKLVISSDQDLDGFHLCGLIINLFDTLWPSLIKDGFLYKLQTPIVRVTQGNNEIDFMTMPEFNEWEKKQTKSFNAAYLKGLASNNTKYFKKYMFEDKYIIPLTMDDEADKNALNIAFDKNKANERKIYIYGED